MPTLIKYIISPLTSYHLFVQLPLFMCCYSFWLEFVSFVLPASLLHQFILYICVCIVCLILAILLLYIKWCVFHDSSISGEFATFNQLKT